MNEQPRDIDTLIRRLLSGEATEDEKELLHAWLDASESNRQGFAILKKIWENQLRDAEFSHTDQLSRYLWQTATASESKPEKVKKIFPWDSFLKVAAALIFIIASFLLYQYNLPLSPKEELSALLVVKENPPGQKSKIILPDSTVIWLNAASSLSYHKPFTDSVRSVELKGEAYFEVAEDPERPFVVKSGSLYTTALGTSFNISSYEEQHQVRVALLSGKVKVEDEQDQQAYLFPGQGLLFDKESRQYADFEVDRENILAWKNGVLVFEDDDFETFRFKLEKWYGVIITVQGKPSQDWRLQGRYDGVYLDDLLDNIKYNKSFTYKLEGKRLMIKF